MTDYRPSKGKVTVRFKRREDGGLRAYCADVPGFYLSSIHRRDLMHDVIPALETLMKVNYGLQVQISPLGYGIYSLIEKGAPPLDDIPNNVPEYEREYVVDPIAA